MKKFASHHLMTVAMYYSDVRFFYKIKNNVPAGERRGDHDSMRNPEIFSQRDFSISDIAIY